MPSKEKGAKDLRFLSKHNGSNTTNVIPSNPCVALKDQLGLRNDANAGMVLDRIILYVKTLQEVTNKHAAAGIQAVVGETVFSHT